MDQKKIQDAQLSRALLDRGENRDDQYKRYTKIAIPDTYYMLCIKKCFVDYNNPLDTREKICLAKCIDRAYDYFALSSNHLNPFKGSQFNF